MSLDTVSTTIFYTLIDAATSTVAAAHAQGDATLIVASAAPFGTPSPGAPVRLTALRASDGARVHYSATGVSGDTLTVAAIDGYADLDLSVGDAVYVSGSAESFEDIHAAVLACQSAINQHAANAAPLAGPTFTGIVSAGEIQVMASGDTAITASSDTANGLVASSTSGNGVVAISTSGYGVQATSTSGRAGYFRQAGTLTAGATEPTLYAARVNSLNGFDSTGAIVKLEDTSASTGDLITAIKQGTTILSLSGAGTLTIPTLAVGNLTGTPTTTAPPTNDATLRISTTGFVMGQQTIEAAARNTAIAAAISGLAVDSAVVHNTGNEAISGTKTFASTIAGSVNGSASTLNPGSSINGVTFTGGFPITIAAAAGTLTGTTLNASVVTSSLTSVGTITSGTWQGSIVAAAYGGTSNGFTAFTGPTTSTKTFTLPNASDTVACLGTAGTFTKQQNFGTSTLTDASSIAWDVSGAQVAKVTLGGNRTLAAPTNLVDGGTYVLRVIQDGTGSRTLAYNAAFKWAGGTAPTLSTAAGAIDVLTFVSDGTNLYGSCLKGFA